LRVIKSTHTHTTVHMHCNDHFE